MASVFRAFLLVLFALAVSSEAQAEQLAATPAAKAEAPAAQASTSASPFATKPVEPKAKNEGRVVSERVLGKASAPVKVDEYSSLTCTHCAHFYLHILPELEKRYVDTGKVRFVMHEFPLNAMSLKAAAVAQCMPKDIYFPFVKTLFEALETGKFGGSNSETVLYQYAALGGLPADKASACANDTDFQNAIIAVRTKASAKHKIEATPTFIIDDGAEIISGALDVDAFVVAFDRQLAAKKK